MVPAGNYTWFCSVLESMSSPRAGGSEMMATSGQVNDQVALVTGTLGPLGAGPGKWAISRRAAGISTCLLTAGSVRGHDWAISSAHSYSPSKSYQCVKVEFMCPLSLWTISPLPVSSYLDYSDFSVISSGHPRVLKAKVLAQVLLFPNPLGHGEVFHMV